MRCALNVCIQHETSNQLKIVILRPASVLISVVRHVCYECYRSSLDHIRDARRHHRHDHPVRRVVALVRSFDQYCTVHECRNRNYLIGAQYDL